MENAALIRSILAREQADMEGKQRWDSHISELEEVALRFRAMSDVIDVVVHTATPKLRDELESISEAFKAELADIQANTRRESSQVIDRIGSELDFIAQHHARSFDSISPILQTSLSHDLNTVLSLFQAQTLQTLDIANSAQELWINLTQHFDDLQQTECQTTKLLSKPRRSRAQLILDAQHSATVSASNLAEVLARLTATTHDSLEQFNASAVLLTQSLSPRTGLSEFMRLVDMVWRLDPHTVTSLHHLPIFPIVSAVFGFLLALFRSSLAALMSFALFLLSTRKYAKRPASSETPYPAPSTTMIHREPNRREIRKSRIPERLCRRPSRRN
ncbi:hypothetical protein FB45DRAFT_908121 [Roridomyces roridus]|uniref:Nuclear fusion protein KAR5 n=1 Tax=Roridomyces roridus TaxID=1738132 RepID=A0AAD7C2B9_9AGAR|nr:hypothetical protein FB45DRAFT_908121 [Roridomyces roridus]